MSNNARDSVDLAPAIAVVPFGEEGILLAVTEAGGRLTEAEDADGIIWTDSGDPEKLRVALVQSSARWVQLPMAGIERFFAAGLIGPERTWTCAKGVHGYACAEHALALMLGAARRIHDHARSLRWIPEAVNSAHRMLKGSTILVVGTGGICVSLLGLLLPFGVRPLAVNRSGRPAQGAQLTVTDQRLDEVLPESDFVVIAAALTAETTRLFDAEMISYMRSDSWLINVARGAIIDTDALVESLRSEMLGGAALDVTDPEPLPDDHPLWTLEQVIITPHIANTSAMMLPQLRQLVNENVRRFATGETLLGVIDPALGY